MRKWLFSLGLALLSISTGFGLEPPRQLAKADVLPLALDDQFEFRKIKLFLNDPVYIKPAVNQMVAFERERANFKAVTYVDSLERTGHYFTFFWRAVRKADLTVRLEYRQQNLSSYVQAQEVAYADVKGSRKTEFKVLGDDYAENGRITSWRALLIENGKIVGLTQSYLWN